MESIGAGKTGFVEHFLIAASPIWAFFVIIFMPIVYFLAKRKSKNPAMVILVGFLFTFFPPFLLVYVGALALMSPSADKDR